VLAAIAFFVRPNKYVNGALFPKDVRSDLAKVNELLCGDFFANQLQTSVALGYRWVIV
jgi:hypothetical protein